MFREGNEWSRSHDRVECTLPEYGTHLAAPMWNNATAPPGDQQQIDNSPPPSYESIVEVPRYMTHQPPSPFITPSAEQAIMHSTMSEYNQLHQINDTTLSAQQWNRWQPITEHNLPSTSEGRNMFPTGHHWNIQRLNTAYINPQASQRAPEPHSTHQSNIERSYPEHNDPTLSLPVNDSNRTSFQNINSSRASTNFTLVCCPEKSRGYWVFLILLSLMQSLLAIMLMIHGGYHNIKTLSYGIVFISFICYIIAALISLGIKPCSNQTQVTSFFIAVAFIFSSVGFVFNLLDVDKLVSCNNSSYFFWSSLHCGINNGINQALFYIILGINALILLMSMLAAIFRKVL